MTDESAAKIVECQRVEFGNRWQDNYPVLLRKARRLSSDGPQDAEDLLSQATVKVLAYLTIEREVENFTGLMLVSLLQVHQDNRRRRGNRIFAEAEEFFDHKPPPRHCHSFPGVERSYIAKETLGDIFDYLATMPKSLQEVFRLRFINDLSYKEISERMQISEVCARQKVRKLRTRLQAWIDD